MFTFLGKIVKVLSEVLAASEVEMKTIQIEEEVIKVMTLDQDQVLASVRQYIKHKAIPPREASVMLHLFDGTLIALEDVEGIEIRWSE
jgi:hypothetical protein